MIDELRKIASDAGILVVLTLGADGSIAFSRDKVCRQAALPLQRVVDTTGCGDAFQAAFTCEFLRTGNLQEALLQGAMAGRIAAGRFGAAEWF